MTIPVAKHATKPNQKAWIFPLTYFTHWHPPHVKFGLVWWRVLRLELSYTVGLLSLLGKPQNAADHGATVCLGITSPKPWAAAPLRLDYNIKIRGKTANLYNNPQMSLPQAQMHDLLFAKRPRYQLIYHISWVRLTHFNPYSTKSAFLNFDYNRISI